VQQAMQLNSPLIAMQTQSSIGPLPPVSALAAVDADNVIIDWVKKHEDSDAIIVRLYEACGQRGEIQVTFGRKPARVAECDLMEENDRKVGVSGHTVRLYVTPFEIRTLKVTFAP
jgi:alpha-mannosidase